MTKASRQPKDKNYNLIEVLHQRSKNAELLKTYVQDAFAEDDDELMEFFGAVLENNLKAAQRAKELLVPRLQNEQENPTQDGRPRRSSEPGPSSLSRPRFLRFTRTAPRTSAAKQAVGTSSPRIGPITLEDTPRNPAPEG